MLFKETESNDIVGTFNISPLQYHEGGIDLS